MEHREAEAEVLVLKEDLYLDLQDILDLDPDQDHLEPREAEDIPDRDHQEDHDPDHLEGLDHQERDQGHPEEKEAILQ